MKTLVIEGQLDGLNEYTAACRAYKMAGARMKKKNQAHISLYIRNQLDGFSVDGQAALRFRWYEPNRGILTTYVLQKNLFWTHLSAPV